MGLFSIFRKRPIRRIIVGLDGVPYPMLEAFMADGTMPAMRDLATASHFVPMRSSVPHISSVAWSSLITGTNPGRHGIYGFMELAPGSYGFEFPNATDLKVPPFWQAADKRRSAIINVPSTYPAQALNGVLIAGFVAVDLAKATYPQELLPRLKEFDYRTDTDASQGHDAIELFLEDLNATLDARLKTYAYLWEQENWDTFMLVITGTDRLCHFLYEAFEQEDHTHRQAFRDYFVRIDGLIAEIAGRLQDNDLLMMMSDHGFGHMQSEVYLNRYLAEQGFLGLNTDEPRSFEALTDTTRAFVLDPSRVYVHTTDRYPRGCVAPADRAAVLKDLEQALGGFELNGQPVIQKILRAKDAFEGPCTAQAPDLVLIEHEGFDLKAKLSAAEISGRTAFTGKHTPDDAFLLVRPPAGAIVELPDAPSVYDFRAIMESLAP